MANEHRVRANFLGGIVDDDPLAIDALSLTSTGLAAAPAIGSTEHMVVVLDPSGLAGAPEVVYVTEHDLGSPTAAIERGKEDTVARVHAKDTLWRHGPTVRDFEDFGAKPYVHAQLVASATWTITHNLGHRPQVHVEDSAGTVCYGGLLHLSNDELEITFSAAFGGTAYLT